MLGGFRQAAQAWREIRRFRALPGARRKIVFYAEDGGAWAHLGPVVTHLTDERRQQLCYLTSAANDPILQTQNPNIMPFFVGGGHLRTFVFQALDAGLLVMTMPDLGTFHIKRSRNPVHYLYLHHTMVSTHMIYRPGAFDQFDTVFCVGPYHVAEIRAREALHDLPRKTLIEHGYGRLDTIISAPRDRRSRRARSSTKRILIAPSYGPNALLETCGAALVGNLLDAGFQVTLRPHPITRRHSVRMLKAIYAAFSGHDRFVSDENMVSQDSLLAADLMISDWSGAALEFAFGQERPVMFVDVPRKINNPDYEALGMEPIEVSIRSEIGAILDPGRVEDAPKLVNALCTDQEAFRGRIRKVRGKAVYNLGASSVVGGNYIADLAESLSFPTTP